MIVVNVYIHVEKNYLKDFILATVENVKNSILEPGIYRFEFMQQIDDESHFLLVECYKNKNAMLEHKNTSHYQKWRDTVAVMMAEPRYSTKYIIINSEADN